MESQPIEVRCGSSRQPARATKNGNSITAPMTKRTVMIVTGETSRSAAFVATNDMPQKMMARRAPKRGRMRYVAIYRLPVTDCRLAAGSLRLHRPEAFVVRLQVGLRD